MRLYAMYLAVFLTSAGTLYSMEVAKSMAPATNVTIAALTEKAIGILNILNANASASANATVIKSLQNILCKNELCNFAVEKIIQNMDGIKKSIVVARLLYQYIGAVPYLGPVAQVGVGLYFLNYTRIFNH